MSAGYDILRCNLQDESFGKHFSKNSSRTRVVVIDLLINIEQGNIYWNEIILWKSYFRYKQNFNFVRSVCSQNEFIYLNKNINQQFFVLFFFLSSSTFPAGSTLFSRTAIMVFGVQTFLILNCAWNTEVSIKIISIICHAYSRVYTFAKFPFSIENQ